MDSKVLNQLARYCAYQERCVSEIKQKMKSLLLDESDHADYLGWLSENNYLNEVRFVELYVRSKFNQKHWGRNKIMFELKKRGIPESLLSNVRNEIAEADYTDQLKKLILKKKADLKLGTAQQKYQKCYAFAMSKGYESSLIVAQLKGLF
jgi:regulatory protein